LASGFSTCSRRHQVDRDDNGLEEAREEGLLGRPEGNADAYRRQETGQGDRGEEAGGKVAAEVSLACRVTTGDAGRLLRHGGL
jgi:hypothetical protein